MKPELAKRVALSAACRVMGFGLLVASACQTEYRDERDFRRALEEAYVEAHPGWRIRGRAEGRTYFVRADQMEEVDVGALWASYQVDSDRGSFLERWEAKSKAAYQALRKELTTSPSEIFPLLKSARWVRRQDLGAIGPASKRRRIRPWRKEFLPGLYLVLGLQEGKRGVRYLSLAEVEDATERSDDAWLELATDNLLRRLEASSLSERGRYEGVEMVVRDDLKAFDLENELGVSAWVLDAKFRQAMLAKFGAEELGAAIPVRDVLIVFKLGDITAVKPIRNRTVRLHDTQNHPAFRGLLRIEAERVSILEPAKK